jgi:ligand-binding SRPBCC domain-containing protein
MNAQLRRLECRQLLPLSLAETWDFFSRPEMLACITPPDLGFDVTSPLPERMYAGMIVCYRVSPFGGLRIPWVTEITQVREPEFFVDEQRSGPYHLWHHQHHFRSVAGGVEMTDLVHYQLPCGFVGDLLVGRLVERRVATIFHYRRRVLAERFPSKG